MNCLFCFQEIDLKSPPLTSNSNTSQLICKTLSNLFSTLSNSTELFYVKNQNKLIDTKLCLACFKYIDQVQDTFKELEAVQKRIKEFRQKIQNELIDGYKKSIILSKGQQLLQLQASESFQLRKSIVQNIAPSVLDKHDVLADYDDKEGEENTTTEDFNNFQDFDDDLPILSPYSTFDDLNLNLNEIKPTFGSLWNLKPLQIVLTRCDEENIKPNENIVKVYENVKSSYPLFKNEFQRKSKSKTKTLFSDYKCVSCDMYFALRYNYRKHMSKKHNVDINADVKVKTIDDLVSLDSEESETDDDLPDDDTHMSYETFKKIINVPEIAQCPKCKKMYMFQKKSERKRSLYKHLTTVHSIQIKLKREKTSTVVAKYAKYYKIEKINGVEQVTCQLCSKLFEGRGLNSRLTRHFDSIHKPNNSKKRVSKSIPEPRGEFICGKCRAKFSKRSFLEKHECFPERLNLLKSSVSAQINENTTLLQLDGGIELDKIQCDQCGKLFEGTEIKGRIKDHLLRIHNIDIRKPKEKPIKKEKGPYFCNYPGCVSARLKIVFISMGHLRLHMKSHGELIQLEHQCDRCTESFESSIRLRDHQRKMHEGKKNSFICDVCAKVFDKISGLTNHRRAMHQLRYACHVPNCNKIYGQKINFEYHLRSYHGLGEKLIYQCEHCNYSANRRLSYELHISKHTELRKFKCELCNVAVKTQRGLNGHMFTCHTHPKSAKRQCSECEMSFLCKRELDNHLIVRHNIGQKIKCTYCPKTFFIRRYMRNHVKKDHPNEDKAKHELMKRWVPLELLEAPLEVQKELISSITASEQSRKENEQKNP